MYYSNITNDLQRWYPLGVIIKKKVHTMTNQFQQTNQRETNRMNLFFTTYISWEIPHTFGRFILHTMNFWPRLLYFYHVRYVCTYQHFYIKVNKKKTGLWTSKTRSYFWFEFVFRLNYLPLACYHTYAHTKMCRHISRAWINYWKWIRNSVDGQWMHDMKLECNISNDLTFLLHSAK